MLLPITGGRPSRPLYHNFHRALACRSRADSLSTHSHDSPVEEDVEPHPHNKRRPLGDETYRSVELLIRRQP